MTTITASLARTAAIRLMFTLPNAIETSRLAELSLTVLSQDRECISLLNALFWRAQLSRDEQLELKEAIGKMFQARNPAFNRQISTTEIASAMIVLLADTSGIPESVLIFFLNELRRADPDVEALGSLFSTHLAMMQAIESFWKKGSDRND